MGQLLEQCHATKCAYLCHPCVQHVSKLKKEGMCDGVQAFCYKNGSDLVARRFLRIQKHTNDDLILDRGQCQEHTAI
jgi:hypothetical protein